MQNTAAPSSQALLVFSTCPDDALARRIAEAVLDARLAACVHLFPSGWSYYRWQGRIQQETELTLLMKSNSRRYPALETLILSLHSYEVPEIVAIPVSNGLPGYLRWLEESVREAPD